MFLLPLYEAWGKKDKEEEWSKQLRTPSAPMPSYDSPVVVGRFFSGSYDGVGNAASKEPPIRESRSRNMTKIVHATFDGQVLRPDEPLALLPNTRVVVTIETLEECSASTQSFLKTARSLNLEGPPDWSTRLDEYLYGDKVRDDE